MLQSSVKAKFLEQMWGERALREGPAQEPSMPWAAHWAQQRREDCSRGTQPELLSSLQQFQDLQQKGGKKKQNTTFFLMHVFCFQGSLSTKYFWNSRWQNANFPKGEAALSGRLPPAWECCAREGESKEPEVIIYISGWTTWLENDDHIYVSLAWRYVGALNWCES